jgi:thioredoxin reductase (NADPH)
MSDYLSRRIQQHPQIETHLGTEVTALHGHDQLMSVDLTRRFDHTVQKRPCVGLFFFIGAIPATDWLDGISLDDHGFVLTGTDLTEDLAPIWTALGRRRLPLETSIPRVFAAGDVRHGSTKRVAAAVGEGSSAIPSIYRAITTGIETDTAGPPAPSITV